MIIYRGEKNLFRGRFRGLGSSKEESLGRIQSQKTLD